MHSALARALLFALGVLAASIAVDVAVILARGGMPEERAREFLIFRTALHGATVVLATAGSALGFSFLRAYAIARIRVFALGASLGLFTLSAALLAVRMRGFWFIALGLVLAAALISYFGGKALADKPRLPAPPR